jgi:carbon monoxide dehydrogenase subunit G
MEMTGEQLIPLPQAEVWRGLNDPNVLKACIPGCESIDKVSDSEYRVAMTASVGPVKAKFSGKLALSDLNPPTSYSLSFEGSGGAAGFGKGSAHVSLRTEGAGTRLTYTAKANVGGKLAQVGSRLIDGVAKKMADDFFVAFNRTLAGASQPAGGASPGGGVSSGGDAGTGSMAKVSNAPLWWVAATILAMLAVYYSLSSTKFIT